MFLQSMPGAAGTTEQRANNLEDGNTKDLVTDFTSRRLPPDIQMVSGGSGITILLITALGGGLP